MKKRRKWIHISVVICLNLVIVMACVIYFHFISNMIYEESSQHLTEIYNQVNASLDDMVTEKWELLKLCNQYLCNTEEDDKKADFIRS